MADSEELGKRVLHGAAFTSEPLGPPTGPPPVAGRDPEADEAARWERCPTVGCRGAAIPEREFCIAHLDAKAAEAALRRFSRGRVLDLRGTVLNAEIWDRVLQAAPVDAVGRRRLSGAILDHAVFDCPVSLDETSFTSDARFDGARFLNQVSFKDARVVGQARFAKASFQQNVDFEGARLDGPAWFAETDFSSPVSFRDTTFGGSAWFTGARFESDAIFDAAAFDRHAAFDRVEFGCHAYFEAAVFEADASFTDATFANPGIFEDALFKGLEGLPVPAAKKSKWWGPPIATWRQRAIAALIDWGYTLGILAGAGLMAWLFVILHNRDFANGMLVIGAVAAVWFAIRNRGDEGESGQSAGKRSVGVRLLQESTRRPVGTGRALARQALHLLDTLPLFAGWLWPLRDDKRRTFADIIMGTVVVEVNDNWQRTNADGPPARLTSAAAG